MLKHYISLNGSLEYVLDSTIIEHPDNLIKQLENLVRRYYYSCCSYILAEGEVKILTRGKG